MRWLVAMALLEGCGFELELDNMSVVDARPDTMAVDAETVDTAAFTCPTFYRTIGSGMYLVLTPTTFRNHHAACLSHGTHLAVIDSREELDDLVIYGRTVLGTTANSRFYVGLVQAPMEAEPDSGWVDFHDRDAEEDLWAAENGPNEPNDGPDDNETNHQEQAGAIQLDREGLTDLAGTENVRAYCECDGMSVGPTAAMYVAAPTL